MLIASARPLSCASLADPEDCKSGNLIDTGSHMNSSRKYEKSNALMKTSQALAVSVLCFAAATPLAQVSTTRTSDGAMLSHTPPKVSTVLPKAQSKVEEPLPAGATVVYSTLGTGTSVYNSGTGWTEAGAEANDYPLAE